MNKLEQLVKEYVAAETRVSGVLQEFTANVVFKGFEKYERLPVASHTAADGIMLFWDYPRADELFADDVIRCMKEKGYVCPEDFGIWEDWQ